MDTAVSGAPQIGLSSLLRLRWGVAVATAALTLVAGPGLGVRLAVLPLLALSTVIFASNVALVLRLRRKRETRPLLLGGVLALDTLTLTGMLVLSGGPSNPFSALYLVYVTLAAVVLGRAWTWAIVALSVASYGTLFLFHIPPGGMGHMHSEAHGGTFDAHLQAMFLAFAVTAALIAYLVVEVASALRARDEELAAARDQAARNARLVSLTTLAAGAAHELSTPLGTIAVVAGELEREATRLGDEAGVAEDARLIRAEVARCRRILEQMSARSGESAGELPEPVAVRDLVGDVRAALPAERARGLSVELGDLGSTSLSLPRQAFVQVLLSLVRNAFDASASGTPVDLAVARVGGLVRFSVRDRGSGMSEEVLARAVEPFFTTKEAGEGMGLGLFLAQALADRLGGRLWLESTAEAGTTANLEVPA